MATVNIYKDILDADVITFENDGKTIKEIIDDKILSNSQVVELCEVYDSETGKTTYESFEVDSYKVVIIADGNEVDVDFDITNINVLTIFCIPQSEVVMGWAEAIIGVIEVVVGIVLAATGVGAIIAAPLIIGGTTMLLSGGATLYSYYTSRYDVSDTTKTPTKDAAVQSERLLGINGAQNQSILSKKYPIILGKHLLTPMIIGAPYNETLLTDMDCTDNGQYLRCLYLLGYGPCMVNDFKIGSINLAYNRSSKEFPDCETVFHGNVGNILKKWKNNDVSLELLQAGSLVDNPYGNVYPEVVKQSDVNANLIFINDGEIDEVANVNYKGVAIESTFRSNTVRISEDCPAEIEVELDFPSGLYWNRTYKTDDKIKQLYGVPRMAFAVQWRYIKEGQESSNPESSDGWNNFDSVNLGPNGECTDDINSHLPRPYTGVFRLCEYDDAKGKSKNTSINYNNGWLNKDVFILNADKIQSGGTKTEGVSKANILDTFTAIGDVIKQDSYLISGYSDGVRSVFEHPYKAVLSYVDNKGVTQTITKESKYEENKNIPKTFEYAINVIESLRGESTATPLRLLKRDTYDQNLRFAKKYTVTFYTKSGTFSVDVDWSQKALIDKLNEEFPQGANGENERLINAAIVPDFDIYSPFWNFVAYSVDHFGTNKNVVDLYDLVNVLNIRDDILLKKVDKVKFAKFEPIKTPANMVSKVQIHGQRVYYEKADENNNNISIKNTLDGWINKTGSEGEVVSINFQQLKVKEVDKVNINERRYVFRKKFTKEEIDTLLDLNNKGLSDNDRVEVRVIRLTPCYLDETDPNFDDNDLGPMSYQDLAKWSCIRVKKIDKKLYEDAYEENSDANPFDFIQKPFSKEDSDKFSYVAVKLKQDISEVAGQSLQQMSCVVSALNPNYDKDLDKWVPEGIKKQYKFFKVTNDDTHKNEITEITEEEYNNGVIVAPELYTKEVCGNNFAKLIKNDILKENNDTSRLLLTQGVIKKYVTQNSAAVFAAAIVGPMLEKNAGVFEDVEMTSLTEFYNFCEDVTDGTVNHKNEPVHIKFCCNGIVSADVKYETLLNKILTTGRSAYTRDEFNRIEVILGKPNPYPVCMLTQKNCLGISNKKTFTNKTSGFFATFQDESDNYSTNDLYIMADGEDYRNPSKEIQNFSIPYVTNREQLWSLGRFNLANVSYQKESYTRTVGKLGISLKLGDTVLLQDDSLLVGSDKGGRIVELIEDDDFIYGFYTDEPFVFTNIKDANGKSEQGVTVLQPANFGPSRCVTLRISAEVKDIGPFGKYIPTPKLTNKVILDSFISKKDYLNNDSYLENGEISVVKPTVDNLVVFGTVKSMTIKANIVKISPKENCTFDLNLVPYNEDLYNSGGRIPDFKTNLSTPLTDLSDFNFDTSIKLEDVKNETENSLNIGSVTHAPPSPISVKAIAKSDRVDFFVETESKSNDVKFKYVWVIHRNDGSGHIIELPTTVNNETTYSYLSEVDYNRSIFKTKEELKKWVIEVFTVSDNNIRCLSPISDNVNIDTYDNSLLLKSIDTPLNPVAYYSFDELENSVFQKCVIDNASGTYTLTNVFGEKVDGVNGSGLRFDKKEVVLPFTDRDFSLTNAWTTSFWVKINPDEILQLNTNSTMLFGLNNQEFTYGFLLKRNNDTLELLYGEKNSQAEVFINNIPIFEDYTMLSLVRDGARTKVYVNGILFETVNSVKGDVNLSKNFVFNGGVAFSEEASPSAFCVDDFYIFKEALRDEEIIALFVSKGNYQKKFTINDYRLNLIDNDNVISVSEKKELLSKWREIYDAQNVVENLPLEDIKVSGEYKSIIEAAIELKVLSNNIVQKYITSANNIRQALWNEVDGYLIDKNSASVVTTPLDPLFSKYKEDLQNAANFVATEDFEQYKTGESVAPPDVPEFYAKAERDGIEFTILPNDGTMANIIKSYTVYIKKGDGSEVDFTATESELYYRFNRDEDFYPEATDLDLWTVKIKATNVYNKTSDWSDLVKVNTDEYGTWKLNKPFINYSVNDRTVFLQFTQNATSSNKEIYGEVRYGITIARPDIDRDEQEKIIFFTPNETSDPFADELNYKVSDLKEPIWRTFSYSQQLPLKGQNSSEDKKIENTLYGFRVVAENQAGRSEPVDIYITALATSIVDLVKANETTKEAYISSLSAISANLGVISQGAFGGNQYNIWALSNIPATDSPTGEKLPAGYFRVGGEDKYILVYPITDDFGNVIDYDFILHVGALEITTEATSLNSELIIYNENISIFDRTRITTTGTFYEHRDTPTSEWYAISKLETSGLLSRSLLSKESLVIANTNITERRKKGLDIGKPYLSDNSKVYHFDENLADQNGNIEYEITSINPPRLVGAGDSASVEKKDKIFIDFTPAILAVAPYSEVGRALYGQYNLKFNTHSENNCLTVDFWLQFIYAEGQSLFTIGTEQDYIQIISSSGEPNYNEPLRDENGLLLEPPYNYETTTSEEIVYNHALTTQNDSYIIHGGVSNYEIKRLDEFGEKFIDGQWHHIAVVFEHDVICVYVGHSKIMFPRYSSTEKDFTINLGDEEMHSLIIDEFMIDNSVAEDFDSFSITTDNKIPFGALDYSKKHFILDSGDSEFSTNIFETQSFKNAVTNWIDVTSDFSIVKNSDWANTPTASLRVLYKPIINKLKVWSCRNSASDQSKEHTFALKYNGNNESIRFSPFSTTAQQTLTTSFNDFSTTHIAGFEGSFCIEDELTISLGGYNRNSGTKWGATTTIVADIDL